MSKIFHNDGEEVVKAGFLKMIQFFCIIFLNWISGKKYLSEYDEMLPKTVKPIYENILNPDNESLQVTWVGHSSFLIQMDGVNILTDPLWSERSSPYAWIGPKRKSPPGLDFEKLPKINIVLLSHNHFDHLDLKTLRKFDNSVTFLVPEGLSRWLKSRVGPLVFEYPWNTGSQYFGLKFTSTQAQHWSSRGFLKNRSHWCGWRIDGIKKSIHFIGDTGYSDKIFKNIFAMYGKCDLALIPIGPIIPREFIRPQHADPKDAISIHRDLQAKESIAMHWGCFKLGMEKVGTSAQIIREIEKDESICRIIALGETKKY